MSILIILRGNSNRHNNYDVFYQNHKLKISDYLTSKGYKIDYILSSYSNEEESLNKYIQLFDPIKVYKRPPENSNQSQQFMFTLESIYTNIDLKKYNKIILLRLDIIYKRGISLWNIFDRNGFITPFKEDTIECYNQNKYHSDVIMIIDSEYFNDMYNSYKLYCAVPPLRLEGQYPPPFINTVLHNVGNIIRFYNPQINIYYFIDGFWQSCSEIAGNDVRLNPLFINIRDPYYGNDLNLCGIDDKLIDNNILKK